MRVQHSKPVFNTLVKHINSASFSTDKLKLINTDVAGFDVIARLGEVINHEHYDNGWHAPSTLGAICVPYCCAIALLSSDVNQLIE